MGRDKWQRSAGRGSAPNSFMSAIATHQIIWLPYYSHYVCRCCKFMSLTCFVYTTLAREHAAGLSSCFVKLSEPPQVLATHYCTAENYLCLRFVKSECSFSKPSFITGQQLGSAFPHPQYCHAANQVVASEHVDSGSL